MIRLLALVVALTVTGLAQADGRVFEVVEHAAEVMQLELSADARQLVYARRCDHCPTLALSIDAKTRVYDGSLPISLDRAAGFAKRGGTLYFDPATRQVTRIVFWPKSRSDS